MALGGKEGNLAGVLAVLALALHGLTGGFLPMN